MSVPDELGVFFAACNLAACVVLVILRIYHQRKQKIEQQKLSLTGLLCMVLALLYCFLLLNLKSRWYFGDIRWCTLTMKLSSATYAIHRVVLYIFIIFRLEVVNHANLINPRLLCAGKVLIGVNGICMVAAHAVFTTGIMDEHSRCVYGVTRRGGLIPVSVIDMFICAAGTWMFIRPIKKIVENIENSNLRNMLRKTKIWSIVCLVSTVLSNLIAGSVDGAAGIIGLDCSITALGLLMMMWPESSDMPSKSSNDSSQAGGVDFLVKTSFTKEKPSSGIKRRISSILLEKMMKGFLSGEPSDNNGATLTHDL